ncbi:hypothetical protein B0H11DRAFT_1237172 [Mycena galericulata]|nr:hypothetical protein B0H11DRAFT_1237172 [Mycena galericulata]
MAPPTIKELIDEPFGPYPDYVILDPGYRPKGAKLPQLRRLRLSQDGQSIGLDTSERYLSSPKKASSPVLFFGVLVIEKLTWLSEAGKQFLTCDLNERDGNWTGQRSSQNSRKSTQFRNLTLPGLYGQKPSEGFKIKVWIRCEKEVPAMFMTDPTYSQSLLLGSIDQFSRSIVPSTISAATFWNDTDWLR